MHNPQSFYLEYLDNLGRCHLCNQERNLTFHHLIPRKVHARNFFKKMYSKKELNLGINVCRLCHSGIHKLYSEEYLAKELNTIDKLKSDQNVIKHCNWSAKQKTKGK